MFVPRKTEQGRNLKMLVKYIGIDGAKIMDLKESTSAWNCLAKKLQADIPSQPALLTGGQLSEYQMQVRPMPT
jgi:hypothetical protein